LAAWFILSAISWLERGISSRSSVCWEAMAYVRIWKKDDTKNDYINETVFILNLKNKYTQSTLYIKIKKSNVLNNLENMNNNGAYKNYPIS
jgi:hypothetical protein